MAQSHEKFRHGAASSHEFLRNDPLTRGKFAAAVTGLTTDGEFGFLLHLFVAETDGASGDAELI